MNKGAIISNDGKYRYSLHRIWDENLPKVAFIGLNPSTADDRIDDPTIKRCIEFVKGWGYGGFYMLNLFAYRATNPKELTKTNDPIGVENENHILETLSKVAKVICAWGNEGVLLNQNSKVLALIDKPYCLKINSSGEPAHPLYLNKGLLPIEFLQKDSRKESNTKKQIEAQVKIKSNNIVYSKNIEKVKLYQHIQKHFSENENLINKVKISDDEIIFRSEDEIYIGSTSIYWYSSRVGEYYTKSNGELDAEHESDAYKINHTDINCWKAVSSGNNIFLELELEEGKSIKSVQIDESDFENLMRLQKELNETTNALRK